MVRLMGFKDIFKKKKYNNDDNRGNADNELTLEDKFRLGITTFDKYLDELAFDFDREYFCFVRGRKEEDESIASISAQSLVTDEENALALKIGAGINEVNISDIEIREDLFSKEAIIKQNKFANYVGIEHAMLRIKFAVNAYNIAKGKDSFDLTHFLDRCAADEVLKKVYSEVEPISVAHTTVKMPIKIATRKDLADFAKLVIMHKSETDEGYLVDENGKLMEERRLDYHRTVDRELLEKVKENGAESCYKQIKNGKFDIETLERDIIGFIREHAELFWQYTEAANMYLKCGDEFQAALLRDARYERARNDGLLCEAIIEGYPLYSKQKILDLISDDSNKDKYARYLDIILDTSVDVLKACWDCHRRILFQGKPMEEDELFNI